MLWPIGPKRLVYLDDGVVAPELPEPLRARRGDPPPEHGLILPAFADWHFHWVQMDIAGAAGGAAPSHKPGLLDWLRDTAWPAEERFADETACRAAAPEAVRRLARVGTAAGSAYGSSHPGSADAFLGAAADGFLCGPAVMTSGDPPALVRPLDAAMAGLESLRLRHGRRLVVSPRFALSCNEDALAALGRFAAEHELLIQTHLSETTDEVATVRSRFKDARDYLDVYERAGLLGRRTLIGHAIHVSDSELERIAGAGATVIHCPTSNRALGSGRMPLERLRKHGVRWVLGSDVGAGPNLCMLDAMSAAMEQHAAAAPLSAAEAFHRATIALPTLLARQTEDGGGCGHRPGAIVVTPPSGVSPNSTDAEEWLGALLADWRAHGRFEVRRVVPWPVT